MPASVLDEENQLELIRIIREENSQDPVRNGEILDSLILVQGKAKFSIGTDNPIDTVDIPGIASNYNLGNLNIDDKIDGADFQSIGRGDKGKIW